MYAIFALGKHQYRVEPDADVTVFRRDAEEGEMIDLEDVLLIRDEEETLVGRPRLEDASISATVEEHYRGDKITVFNYKRREGRRRKLGHRDELTRLKIHSINRPDSDSG